MSYGSNKKSKRMRSFSRFIVASFHFMGFLRAGCGTVKIISDVTVCDTV